MAAVVSLDDGFTRIVLGKFALIDMDTDKTLRVNLTNFRKAEHTHGVATASSVLIVVKIKHHMLIGLAMNPG